MTVISLRQTGAWLERTTRRFRWKNSRENVEHEGNVVLSQDVGVFLFGLNDVRNFFVVDAGNKIVYDCVEDYGVKMDPSVFDRCDRDDARFRAVTELRQLNVQSVRKRGRKPRKLNPENWEAKRISSGRQ